MSKEPAPTSDAIASMYDFSVLRQIRRRESLTLQEVADRSGLSTAVISRLERNLTHAELTTLYRLGRVFGMNAADLLTLAERRTAQRVDETSHESDGFAFREIRYGNVRALLGEAEAGASHSRPEIHKDDYELCWVLHGRLRVTLPHESHELEAGEAVQFDAILEHTLEALDRCRFVILHLRKDKRF